MLSLPWPLPALLTWAAAWGLAWGLQQAQAPLWSVALLPTAMAALLSLWPAIAATTWRRVFVAAGFPLSVLAMGQGAGLPAWAWLAPLALLLLAYPMRSWRDAPVFPTPLGALDDLPRHVPLAAGARILDAGCGMGDGLLALRSAYPQAQFSGVEWSWMWWAVCKLRCPWAQVRRGDMWADDWSQFDLVYLFQRPETMPRAWAKAVDTMKPGAWLVSLEFMAVGPQGQAIQPRAHFTLPGGRPIWVYCPRPVQAAAHTSTLRA